MKKPVLRTRICFLRIRILEFFSNPDPDSDPDKKTQMFSKAITKFGEKFLFSIQKVGILFLFQQPSRYFTKQGTFIWYNF